MNRVLSLATLAALAVTVGCVNERTYVGPGGGGDDYYGIQKGVSDEGFSRGTIAGDLGPIRGINDNRAAVTGYAGDEFGGSSSVQVTGAGTDGTGFIILDFWSMNLATAEPGVYETNLETGDVGVTICSDSYDGSIHFDAMAEEATVVIEDIDVNTREINIESTVRDYEAVGESTTTQTASFRMER